MEVNSIRHCAFTNTSANHFHYWLHVEMFLSYFRRGFILIPLKRLPYIYCLKYQLLYSSYWLLCKLHSDVRPHIFHRITIWDIDVNCIIVTIFFRFHIYIFCCDVKVTVILRTQLVLSEPHNRFSRLQQEFLANGVQCFGVTRLSLYSPLLLMPYQVPKIIHISNLQTLLYPLSNECLRLTHVFCWRFIFHYQAFHVNNWKQTLLEF